jgi:hypothetical protein
MVVLKGVGGAAIRAAGKQGTRHGEGFFDGRG